MDENPDAIRLKAVPLLSSPRTVFKQRDPALPVFVGHDWSEPDWECGHCGNVLATGVMIQPHGEGVVRYLPPATGGDASVLTVEIRQETYIQSSGGSMIVKCARCGSFNELVPADE
ncbi:MAG: hypothetical protein ABSD96_21865 [Candidatus Korobacteraceae bacterium]|jgi:hypothetical protein